jgi:competence protein CoiA
MPLRCTKDGRDLLAFDITSDQAWEELRAQNARSKSLRLPCCQSEVVLRTSKLGTRHFAHASRGDCAWASETAQHLLAKRLIAEAVREALWEPLLEQAGTSITGEEWRADVLALKPGSNARVAIEVQWSQQTIADTEARQARYKSAGIRGLWLFQQANLPISDAIPAFRLEASDSGLDFTVALPSHEYVERVASRPKPGDECQWGQRVEIKAFVRGALSGKLQFAPALRDPVPMQVFAATIFCWRCKRETNVITELRFPPSDHLAAREAISVYWDEVSGADEGRFLIDFVARYLPPQLLKELGIGVIKARASQTADTTYVSNGCIHCDRIQGNFYVAELREQATEAFGIPVKLEERLAEQWPGLWGAVTKWVLRE